MLSADRTKMAVGAVEGGFLGELEPGMCAATEQTSASTKVEPVSGALISSVASQQWARCRHVEKAPLARAAVVSLHES